MAETARVVFAVSVGIAVGSLLAFSLWRFAFRSWKYSYELQPFAFNQVDNGEVITPIMDDYLMKCCDCGLVHRFRFRAIEVKERHPDGSFGYDELDKQRFRVELTAWREDGAPGVPAVYGTISERAEQGKDGGLWKGAEDGR